VLWEDAHFAGPWMQLLSAVSDMGEARRLAEAAGLQPPTKDSRLARGHPLCDVALQHPGQLLWRADADPDHCDGFNDKPWRLGVEEARRFRDQDVERYTRVVEAVKERRKVRRKHQR